MYSQGIASRRVKQSSPLYNPSRKPFQSAARFKTYQLPPTLIDSSMKGCHMSLGVSFVSQLPGETLEEEQEGGAGLGDLECVDGGVSVVVVYRDLP